MALTKIIVKNFGEKNVDFRKIYVKKKQKQRFIQDVQVCCFCSTWNCAPHPNWQMGHVCMFPFSFLPPIWVPRWVLSQFYFEKWIWVVVLWLSEITDRRAPNHGRRSPAPPTIERRQTTRLSPKYTQGSAEQQEESERRKASYVLERLN